MHSRETQIEAHLLVTVAKVDVKPQPEPNSQFRPFQEGGPEDDFEAIRDWQKSMWLVPAYQNSSADLIGLLLQQENGKAGHFRQVGMTIIPCYVSAENEFVNETLDKNGHF
ncbi:hypothetical protein V8E51_002375 [Hyaloscypha variabilis]